MSKISMPARHAKALVNYFETQVEQSKNKEEAVRLLMGLYKHNGALRTHLRTILVLLGKEPWEL